MCSENGHIAWKSSAIKQQSLHYSWTQVNSVDSSTGPTYLHRSVTFFNRNIVYKQGLGKHGKKFCLRLDDKILGNVSIVSRRYSPHNFVSVDNTYRQRHLRIDAGKFGTDVIQSVTVCIKGTVSRWSSTYHQWWPIIDLL